MNKIANSVPDNITWNSAEDELIMLIQQSAAKLAAEHGVPAYKWTPRLGLCWFMAGDSNSQTYYSEGRILRDLRAAQAKQNANTEKVA